MNFERNYVRLNEWPEWFTVDENTLYRVTDGAGRESLRLGSDLKDGILVVARAPRRGEGALSRYHGEGGEP